MVDSKLFLLLKALPKYIDSHMSLGGNPAMARPGVNLACQFCISTCKNPHSADLSPASCFRLFESTADALQHQDNLEE